MNITWSHDVDEVIGTQGNWFAALTRFIQIRRKPVLSGLINQIRASRLKPEKVQVKAGILFSGGTGCDQIASQHIEEALNPSHWPPAGPQEPAQTPGIPSVMRPCHSWTQRDTAGSRGLHPHQVSHP